MNEELNGFDAQANWESLVRSLEGPDAFVRHPLVPNEWNDIEAMFYDPATYYFGYRP